MTFDGILPSGWHISSRLMAALKLPDESLIEVSKTGEYYITDGGGTVVAHGTDYHPSPFVAGWPDVLCGLLSFLEHDAETYRQFMGPVPEGHDTYLFGDTGAEWAYLNDSELASARFEMDPEGIR